MTHRYGSNVLVTGATSGIGLATARMFAEAGYQVWGVSRSGKTAESHNASMRLSSMDVTSEDSVALAVSRIWQEAIEQTGKGIGTVVHCAGNGIGGAAEDTPQGDAEGQLQTNYFGVLRVNRHLLPLMRRQGPSMVVVVGSIAGRISIPFQSHYSASKFALEAYVEALRMEGRQFGIRASIVEPGDTRTGFTGSRRLAIPEDSPYQDQAVKAIQKMEHDELHGAPPEAVAKAVLAVARSKSPPVRKAVGFGYALLMVAKRLLPDRVAEAVVRMMYLKA